MICDVIMRTEEEDLPPSKCATAKGPAKVKLFFNTY